MKNKQILEMYSKGLSIRQISQELKMARATISKIIKENDIPIIKHYRKYSVDENTFSIIDTQEKAYWLGFLYADGFIESKRKYGQQKLGITLAKQDEQHLLKFQSFLKSNYPVLTYKGSGYAKNNLYCKILITSQKIVDDLINLGCFEKKTKILEFPNDNIVPKYLIRHFIRGYLDGDGSIVATKNLKLSFIGTKHLLEGIKIFFNKPNKSLYYYSDSVYELGFGGRKQVICFLKLLYEDSCIHLDRKYEKFLEVKNMSKDRV